MSGAKGSTSPLAPVPFAPRKTSPIDEHVGRRLRLRRQMLDMGQEELAEAIGVSYQQVQKYERGETRLTVARLFEVALYLNVPLEWFIDGLEPRSLVPDETADALADKETRDLVRLFMSVDDPVLRKRFVDLARALVEPGQ